MFSKEMDGLMMIKVWIVALMILLPIKIAGDIKEYRERRKEQVNQQNIEPAADENAVEHTGGA